MRLPARLLQRKISAHKGDFGHIFCLAGSRGMSGAALLCAEAAMRTGAGLVTLGIPKGLNSSLIKIKPREVMTLALPETKEGSLSLAGYARIKEFAGKADILLIGPGLTQNKATQRLIRKVIKVVNKPMVIDADALNALAGHMKLLMAHSSSFILTPHPGEMARLLGITTKKVQSERKDIAKKFARDYNLLIVLKGHQTVAADRSRLYINKTGNPGMATAGSGDVLSGMIAALWGEGLSAFDAAKYAVYLHGLAGDLAAREKTQMGMIASDIIEKIPEAIKICS